MCRFIIFLIPQFIDRCNAWVIFILLHYEKLHKEMVNWLVLVCQKSNTNQAWKVKKCNIAHRNWMWSCTVLVMFARFLHVNTEPNAGRYLRNTPQVGSAFMRLHLHENYEGYKLASEVLTLFYPACFTKQKKYMYKKMVVIHLHDVNHQEKLYFLFMSLTWPSELLVGLFCLTFIWSLQKKTLQLPRLGMGGIGLCTLAPSPTIFTNWFW